jgi:hypothetical protein
LDLSWTPQRILGFRVSNGIFAVSELRTGRPVNKNTYKTVAEQLRVSKKNTGSACTSLRIFHIYKTVNREHFSTVNREADVF